MLTREEADKKIATGIQFIQYVFSVAMTLGAMAAIIVTYICQPSDLSGLKMFLIMISLLVTIGIFVCSLEVFIRQLEKNEINFRLASTMTVFILVMTIVAFFIIFAHI